MSTVDFSRVNELAQKYEPEMTRFLRDMIRIPSESCQEEGVIRRIKEEMEKVGFDRVEIDKMGNVLGYIGNGPRLIAFDAHIDTVGVGNRSNWTFDPYEGYEDAETIGGRGASDQEGGMASMVYAGKIIKELGLCPKDCTIVMVGTVQEEDCDGLCWQYIINEDGLKPEFVVSTEPTDGGIYRGQRGRMEIRVDVSGVSCHGSAPERGDNAIYRMAHIMTELEQLNARLADDPFLGKGTLTVSQIFYTSPSRCAVADSCAISVDRRLTFGEDKDLAISQIENLPSVKAAGDKAKVSMYTYEVPSWTGLVYPTDCYFPTWVLPEDHVVTKSTEETYRSLFGREPRTDKWTFSTNGVSIMGRYGIPVVGFGPGKEKEAHAPDEKTWKQESVEDQYLALCETMEHIADVIQQGWQVLITHGNGPQVGFIMLRSEIARAVAGMHIVPLVSCVADTQGAIGYQIQQSLDNVLKRRGLADKTGRTVSLVTQVRVDIADPGFSDPDKFVGEFYAEDQLAELHQQHPDWILKPDANRGWRRVVPSPKPCEIIELDAIKNLLDSGFNVVAVGGGGIPVVRMPEGLFGVDAVIDKDLASSLLATQLGADMLAISTGVESVALNYGTPMQRPLHNVPVSEMERYLAEGHFPAGSMGPKIKAAVDFIRNGGSEVVITSPEYLNAALTKGAGTHITRE